MIKFENLLKKLTDNYYKKPTGNIAKILKVITDELIIIKKALDDTSESRGINHAVGDTLDLFGRDARVLRGENNDVDYRKAIKMKLIANLSGGEIETLNEVLPSLLSNSFLGVEEAWQSSLYDNEPAAIVVNYDDQELFNAIESEYEIAESNPYFFDGLFKLDGDRLLDGGYVDLDNTIALRLRSIVQLKKDINDMVAGGVHVYFSVSEGVESNINVVQFSKQNIETLSTSCVVPRYDVSNELSSNVHQSSVNRLDGDFWLDGRFNLDAKRAFIINEVFIDEVENTIYQSAINRLDGSCMFNSVFNLDAKRAFIINDVSFEGVTA